MRGLGPWLLVTLIAVWGCDDEPNTQANPDAGETIQVELPKPGLTVDPVPVESYCEARAGVDCHRAFVCRPVGLASSYGDFMSCMEQQTTACERSYVEQSIQLVIDLGLVRWDPQAMADALSRHSRQSCLSLAPTPSPAAGSVGLKANDAACGSDEVCASGHCTRQPFESCGVCADPPSELPSSCPVDCAEGTACRCEPNPDAGQSCSCEPALETNADCSAWRNGCALGQTCQDVIFNGSPATICRPLPGLGQTCGAATGLNVCVGEAFCDREGSERCESPVLVAAQESCALPERLCPPQHDCLGVCVPRAEVNQECTPQGANIPDGGPPTCASGAGPCLGGSCLGAQSENQFCRNALDCEAPLACYIQFGSGSCQSWDSIKTRIESDFMRCE